jgi:C_GCAxxG_C_C family probable redox protein
MDVKKTPGEFARELHSQGYSCSESVWLALNQDLDQDHRDFGTRLAGAMSGGCGNGALCGAIAGAILAIGRWHGRAYGEPRPAELAKTVKRLTDEFKNKYGDLDCARLKPTTDNWRETCAAMVEYAANLADQLLDQADGEDCG